MPEGVFLRISALGLLRRGVRNQELCSIGEERNSVVSPKLLGLVPEWERKTIHHGGHRGTQRSEKGTRGGCSYAGLCPRGIFNFLPNYDSIL